MAPYRLHIPTRAYFGRDIWKEALEAEEGLLQGNILIVTTGRSLVRLGYVDGLKRQLEGYAHTGKVIVSDNISANPKLSEVERAIGLGREEGIGLVVGLGGGSAMDAAKAAAVCIGTGVSLRELFDRGTEPGEGTLPVIAVPTTAGSGSEMSCGAILTDEARRIKKGIRGKALYPAAAIVDSVFTESLPYRATMETGFDVLAHAMESHVCRNASPFTRMQSEEAVRTAGRCLRVLAYDLQDREAREGMSRAAMLMGINLGLAGTCLPHRLQYPIGAHTDTSHGAGLAALFTAWTELEYRYVPEEMERLLSLLTGKPTAGRDGCAKAVRQFIEGLGLPVSLSGLGRALPAAEELAAQVSGNTGNDPAMHRAGNDREVIRRLYERARQ